MLKKLLQHSIFMSLGVASICSINTAAQTQFQTDGKRWFEVEVLVFKNLRSNLDEELWPAQKAVQYPESLKDIVTETLYPVPEELKAITQNSFQTQNSNNLSRNDQTNDDQALVPGIDGLEPFSLLQEKQLQLTPLANSLARSSQYRPLSHFSWRQSVESKSQAPWVRVVGGKNYYDKFEHNGQLKSNASTPARYSYNSTISNETSSINQNTNLPTVYPVPEVDGAIRIYLDRYLHINTKLYLRIPGQEEVDISTLNSNISTSLLNLTDDGVMDPDYESNFGWTFDSNSWMDQEKQTKTVERLLSYSLEQSRRVRSEEIHYFDHPLYGVIVQIRPYDPENNNGKISELGEN